MMKMTNDKWVLGWVKYRGKEYPCRSIDVKCGQRGDRCFLIGSSAMRDAMERKDGQFRQDATEIDEYIFHYLDDKLLKTGTDEQITKEIEADDVPRNEW